MVYLPEELLSEVLSRLPVKSLLRFKCVSKLWLRIIDSPNFVEFHLHRQKQDPKSPNLKIMTTRYGYERCFYVWNFDFLKDTIKLESTKLNYPFSKGRLSILGTCNGIIVLIQNVGTSSRTFFFNPSTRKYRQGPVFNMEERYNDFGFGYDTKSQDYKLVVVNIFHGDYLERKTLDICRIYSLKSDSWVSKPVKYGLELRGNFLFFDGALHWIAHELDFPVGRDLVVSIDLETGEWAEPMLLPVLEKYYGLVVLCGSLCALSCGKFLNIWVMKNEGVNKSWNKLFSIADNVNGFRVGYWVWPLAYFASGRQLLMIDKCYDQRFVCYHVDKNRVENVGIHGGLSGYVDAFVYGESLVSV